MVCVCCCPAYLERDIDCLGTQYSQIVIEFEGFGGSFAACGCPNELGAVAIDFYDETQDQYVFCVSDADTYWRADVLVYGDAAIKGAYSPALKGHTILPGGGLIVQIFQRYLSGGTPTETYLYGIEMQTRPIGEECQSCVDFLASTVGVTYEMFAQPTVSLPGCNGVVLDWYLQ